jgi:hypothetical protein
MQASTIRRKIEAHGFVFTELDSGVRVSARGPKTPADPNSDGGRPTVVTAKRDGETLERVEKTTQAAGASAYVRLVGQYSEP